MTVHSQEKILSEVRELLGEAEWLDSRHRWENRAREDALALRKAVDDLKANLRTVRNRGAWLYKAFDAQRRRQIRHEEARR